MKAPRNREEDIFMREVMRLAKLTGWLCYHTHDSRRSNAGFPDLVLVKDRVIFAELKSSKGKLSEAQADWIDVLRKVQSVQVYVWRPADMEEVINILNPSKAGDRIGAYHS